MNNYKNQINKIINFALEEDRINADITSNLAIQKNLKSKVKIIPKADGILFGTNIIKMILKKIDSKIKIKTLKKDGQKIKKNRAVIVLDGNLKSILRAERTVLNFLGHLTGISSETHRLVCLTKKYKTKICCTRKTIPGLRYLQKEAIKCGGGTNNRFDLEQEIFVKDNHHVNSKNFRAKIISIIKMNKNKKVTNIEVDNINQLKQITDLKINRILLDNFSPQALKKALKIIPKRIETEASGNINSKNIVDYAKTGVNRISMGYLTHSVKNFDFSLEF